MPLIEEVTKREEERQKLLDNSIELKRQIKILLAMLKSPKMCDLFFKFEKKNQSEEMFKKSQDDAIFTLR